MPSSDPVKETQINKQKGKLLESIETLGISINNLEDRLNSVLIPETEIGIEDKEAVPEESIVPLATFLRAKCRTVTGLNSKIDSITRRLEL